MRARGPCSVPVSYMLWDLKRATVDAAEVHGYYISRIPLQYFTQTLIFFLVKIARIS